MSKQEIRIKLEDSPPVFKHEGNTYILIETTDHIIMLKISDEQILDLTQDLQKSNI